MNIQTLLIDVDKNGMRKAMLVFRAFNHALRQKILELVEQSKEITVTEVYVTLRLDQSVASQHLAILRSAGFVTTRREGKFIYYSVNPERFRLLHYVSGVINCNTPVNNPYNIPAPTVSDVVA